MFVGRIGFQQNFQTGFLSGQQKTLSRLQQSIQQSKVQNTILFLLFCLQILLALPNIAHNPSGSFLPQHLPLVKSQKNSMTNGVITILI